MSNSTSNVILVNNTGVDTSDYDAIFVAYVRDGKALPAELADLFEITVIEVDDGARGIINWA